MKTVYVADDGTQFDSFDACHQYENGTESKLTKLIADQIGTSYREDFGCSVILEGNVYDFVVDHIDTINKILKKPDQVETCEWISNIGNDTNNPPPTISGDTKVCVKYRNGEFDTFFAMDCGASWKETDGTEYDIVEYRII